MHHVIIFALALTSGVKAQQPEGLITREIQIIRHQDQQLVSLQRYLAASGDITGATEAGLKRSELMLKLNQLQGRQAIEMFNKGDYDTASKWLSENIGRPLTVQRVDNNNFNISLDGQITRRRVPKDEILGLLNNQLSEISSLLNK